MKLELIYHIAKASHSYEAFLASYEREVLLDVHPDHSFLTLEGLLQIVSSVTGISIAKMIKSKEAECFFARYTFFAVARKYLPGASLNEIGKMVSRNHATVWTGLQHGHEVRAEIRACEEAIKKGGLIEK